MKYKIQIITCLKPEVELPDGSIPLSVMHGSEMIISDPKSGKPEIEIPEQWVISYLEPVIEERR